VLRRHQRFDEREMLVVEQRQHHLVDTHDRAVFGRRYGMLLGGVVGGPEAALCGLERPVGGELAAVLVALPTRLPEGVEQLIVVHIDLSHPHGADPRPTGHHASPGFPTRAAMMAG